MSHESPDDRLPAESDEGFRAESSVAESSVAESSVAESSVAESSVAESSVAESSVAESSVAESSVARSCGNESPSSYSPSSYSPSSESYSGLSPRIAGAAAIEGVEEELRILTYLVRLGVHGQVGRLRSIFDSPSYRDQVVLCRTSRGLELGSVLAESETRFNPANGLAEFDGQIVRAAAPEDLYLQKQLRKLADEFTPRAVEAFLGVDQDSVLLDVEPMLDSQTVYFHFLGPVADAMQKAATDLAEEFQRVVTESRVAKLLESGCGPGCGTTRGGCGTSGSGGCSGCAVSRACSTKSV